MGRLEELEAENRILQAKLSDSKRVRVGSRLASVGEGLIKGGAGFAKRLVPTGGIRHPDSVITNGPRRSLYLPKGGGISVLPGVNPTGLNKSLLIGSPRKTRRTKKVGLRRYRLL